MISVLIIEDERIASLHDALNSFTHFNIVTVNTLETAIKANNKQYFDLVFLDTSCPQDDSLKCIRELKTYNVATMIVLFEDDNSQELEHTFLSLGVKDLIKKSIHTELMIHRIKNYIEIIELKKKSLFSSGVVNLFDKHVYQHMVVFKLNSQTARVEFWDYFMNNHFATYKNAQELVGVLYALASWQFLNHKECEIIKETSHDLMYLTLFPINSISDEIIEHVLRSHDENVVYIREGNKLSIKIEKIDTIIVEKVKTSEEKTEQEKILAKTHFNKITAAEFVDMTAISYIDKIDNLADIEDEIDASLIDFETDPSIEKINIITTKFSGYIEVIKLLVEFEHLVFALNTLAQAINEVTQDQLTPKEVKKFTTLMLHLLHDLGTWRDNIFVKQEANDIHYLDSSLLSSCLQIETIFAKKELEEDDDDFELF